MDKIFELVYVMGYITLVGFAIVLVAVTAWNIVFGLAKKARLHSLY